MYIVHSYLHVIQWNSNNVNWKLKLGKSTDKSLFQICGKWIIIFAFQFEMHAKLQYFCQGNLFVIKSFFFSVLTAKKKGKTHSARIRNQEPAKVNGAKGKHAFRRWNIKNFNFSKIRFHFKIQEFLLAFFRCFFGMAFFRSVSFHSFPF